MSHLIALSWLFAGFASHAGPDDQINMAHAVFCIQHAEECPATGPTVIKWSQHVDRDIQGIDHTVNDSIIPRNETSDEWTINPRFGDCDDFVVTKRHALIQLGYPARALRPKVVSRNKPNDHLVLEVVTTKQTYVLDMDKNPTPHQRRPAPDVERIRPKPQGAQLQNLLRDLATSSIQ
ncbi:transglutaminase-like cysteine peptidase [Rhizobium sp. TH2]|uniref:transglutaminase-like cysteine peptidase n=1 Tax=Rhizobium sp. TH2 TaxID=2775403 RepID=UPI00215747B1|nr:transglutaminase-like cysteine peptidase [Rhizobium sp. TH2]